MRGVACDSAVKSAQHLVPRGATSNADHSTTPRCEACVQVGTIMLMYIVALAYAASSPMILPFTLAYFIVSWHVLHARHLTLPRTRQGIQSACGCPASVFLLSAYEQTGRAFSSARDLQLLYSLQHTRQRAIM